MTLIDSVSRLGGAERVAAEIAMRLDPDRFERSLCVTRPAAGGLVEPLRDAGVEVLELRRRFRFDLPGMRPLVSALRRRPVDVVHSHLFGSNLWAAALAPLGGVPVRIAHEHGWSSDVQPLRRLADRHLVARSATLILAVSSEDRQRMIEREGIDPRSVRVLPLGIPAPPEARLGDQLRAQLGIRPGDPVLGTVCRLEPQKALEVLVGAARLLVAEFPRLHVLVVGEGEEQERLTACVHELGLGRHVRFLGRRAPAEIPELLACLDVAVNCSEWEGSPLSVMEYMAAGKPVVATRVGGVPGLIDDGVHGLLVERRDPEALARAVARLLRDPAQRAEMGARGRERQRREFDIALMVRRLEALYEELFRTTRRARRERWAPGRGRP
jgi:glycosyltransferase involved in cell wall biosynthesis